MNQQSGLFRHSVVRKCNIGDFLRILSSSTSSNVFIPTAGIIVLARGCFLHTRQTTQKVLGLGTTNHSSLQDRRRCKGIDKSTKQSLTKSFRNRGWHLFRLSIIKQSKLPCELSPTR